MSGRIATQEEIDKLIQAIDDAFRNVGRGVSWSQSRVIDSHGSREEENAARDKDKDTDWRKVARDPNWTMQSGVGGWSFLDPQGFRYYVAAAMTKILLEREMDQYTFEFQFRLDDGFMKEKWSEFTEEQMRVAAEFVLTMSRFTEDPHKRSNWRGMYEKYWQRLHARKPSKPSKRSPKGC